MNFIKKYLDEIMSVILVVFLIALTAGWIWNILEFHRLSVERDQIMEVREKILLVR